MCTCMQMYLTSMLMWGSEVKARYHTEPGTSTSQLAWLANKSLVSTLSLSPCPRALDVCHCAQLLCVLGSTHNL